MSSQNSRLGLKTARSNSSINNMHHHDNSGSLKSIEGVPGTIREILADSTTLKALENWAMIRVANTSGSTQFVWTGQYDEAPAGTPDITNGLAIPPNSAIVIYLGQSSDPKISMGVKASASTVQVAVIERS
jgi:hypothetical protein